MFETCFKACIKNYAKKKTFSVQSSFLLVCKLRKRRGSQREHWELLYVEVWVL